MANEIRKEEQIALLQAECAEQLDELEKSRQIALIRTEYEQRLEDTIKAEHEKYAVDLAAVTRSCSAMLERAQAQIKAFYEEAERTRQLLSDKMVEIGILKEQGIRAKEQTDSYLHDLLAAKEENDYLAKTNSALMAEVRLFQARVKKLEESLDEALRVRAEALYKATISSNEADIKAKAYAKAVEDRDRLLEELDGLKNADIRANEVDAINLSLRADIVTLEKTLAELKKAEADKRSKTSQVKKLATKYRQAKGGN